MKLKRRSYHLSFYHILIYIISHLWSGFASISYPGYDIYVPKHLTVQQGLCVNIACRFTVPWKETLSRYANGTWYNKDGKLVASKRNTESETNKRFFLRGNIQSGDCSLYIEDPLPDDEDSYYFRVEDDKIKFSYRDIQPYINVTEITDKPEISPIESWVHGEKVKMECTFTDKCKKTDREITWERNIQEARITTSQNKDRLSGLTLRSIITFTARKEHHGSPLSCIVQLTERVTAINHITLNVEYPPLVDITIDGSPPDKISPIIVIEGETKSLECNVDSNPVGEITWFHEGRQLPVINQSLTYILKNISLNHAGSYNCKASNHHGTAEKNISISVYYPPRTPETTCFITSKDRNNSDCTMNDSTIYVSEGSLLSLTCSADSEPVSNLTWMSSNGLEMASPMNTLTLTNLSFADEGPYVCQATNAYGMLRTSVNVKMMYSPRIVDGRNSSCWKVDENHLACTCLIQSFPEPTLKWKTNGKPINVSNHMNGKVSIFTETSNSVTNSTLTLPVNTEERQNIQCVASNLHGELVLELFNETAHSASKAFAAAALYGGGVAVVLILIGILLIIFYRKRKMTKKKERSRQTHVSVTDPIYCNAEMFSNGSHEIEQVLQKDHQPPSEAGSVNLNYQDVQYISVDFSKLNPRVAIEEEEVEYSVVKHTT